MPHFIQQDLVLHLCRHGGQKRVLGSREAGVTCGCKLLDVDLEETNVGPLKKQKEPLPAEPSLHAFLALSLYCRKLRHFFKITGACIEIQPGLDINSVLPLCPMTSQNKITGFSPEAPGSKVFYTCKVDLAPDVRT